MASRTSPVWSRRACAGLACLVLTAAAGPAPAVDPKEVNASVRRGAEFLQQRYKKGAAPDDAEYGIGPAALAGLALLEAGTPADHPALVNITAAVRAATPGEVRTYQIVLCMLYLDRNGDPADEARIQLLAVRLLAGQNNRGGWTYECVDKVPREVEQRLGARLGENQLVAGGEGAAATPDSKQTKDRPPGPPPAARLHPEVQKYAATLSASRAKNFGDDNSNTQFAIIGVWVARGHGIAVESALEQIEKRFLSTQDPLTGGWPYNTRGPSGSPSMTCAGLLGLATAIGRREERLLRSVPTKPAPPAPVPTDPNPKSNDPFFSPPPRKEQPPPKKLADPPVKDPRDLAVQRALRNLGPAIAGEVPTRPERPGRPGGRRFEGRGAGGLNLYFLWSVERVGVVYGLEKIHGVDWYAAAVDALIPAQQQNGSWSGGEYGADVDTAFAVLVLSRSNLVRSLSSKVQRSTAQTELRTGAGPGPEVAPTPPAEGNHPETSLQPPSLPPVPPPASDASVRPANPMTRPPVSTPSEDAAGKLAAELIRAAPPDRARVVETLRDAKGAEYTRALVLAIPLLDGDDKKAARQALADRLARMTPGTLREMMKSTDAECRRGAVLAAAMKDDRAHIPDLIDRLADAEESVARAARAGLKSLSNGKDFGPQPGANQADREVAAKVWREWWATQK